MHRKADEARVAVLQTSCVDIAPYSAICGKASAYDTAVLGALESINRSVIQRDCSIIESFDQRTVDSFNP